MDRFLREALKEAEASMAEGGIPIGSALVIEGEVIGRGHNRRVQRGSPILHAEMDCFENAGRLKPASIICRSELQIPAERTLTLTPMPAGAGTSTTCTCLSQQRTAFMIKRPFHFYLPEGSLAACAKVGHFESGVQHRARDNLAHNL